jgi:hypothetical protein
MDRGSGMTTALAKAKSWPVSQKSLLAASMQALP